MKKFLLFLAKIFNVDLVTEKIIYKDKVIEVPVEVIKEIEVEKNVALEGTIEGDVTVKGNLYVIGSIYVVGNISAHDGIYYGYNADEVRMKAKKEVTAFK